MIRLYKKIVNLLYLKIYRSLLPMLLQIFENHSQVNVEDQDKIDKSARIIKASLTGDVEIGPDSLIWKDVRIHGNVKIGEHAKIANNVNIDGKVEIGKFTSISGPGTDIYAYVHHVSIGNFCSIARNVAIQEYNHDYTRLSSYFMNSNVFNKGFINDIVSRGPIEIGNDVWIGTQTTILSGSIISDGAVIAANSVVNGEIPPYAIAAGSPAKVIRYRFDQDLITRLLKLQWWNWGLDKIKANEILFSGKLTLKDLDHYFN